jgi:hypothetical protein
VLVSDRELIRFEEWGHVLLDYQDEYLNRSVTVSKESSNIYSYLHSRSVPVHRVTAMAVAHAYDKE